MLYIILVRSHFERPLEDSRFVFNVNKLHSTGYFLVVQFIKEYYWRITLSVVQWNTHMLNTHFTYTE